MKTRWLSILVVVSIAFLERDSILVAAGKPKSIDFAGWVTAVNPAARIIEIKGKKIFVFTVDTKRCSVSRNGNWWNQPGAQVGGLGMAKVGDAVIGELSLAGPEPVVVRLDLMAKPQFGLPVTNTPGFIISPYPSSIRTPINVSGLSRETTLKDPSTGKIILVP